MYTLSLVRDILGKIYYIILNIQSHVAKPHEQAFSVFLLLFSDLYEMIWKTSGVLNNCHLLLIIDIFIFPPSGISDFSPNEITYLKKVRIKLCVQEIGKTII